jgi:bifunctional NMN adenylyltransferase/nudix hydrolase
MTNRGVLMSSRKYDIVVCIGRYQPAHNGHINNFKHATEIGDNVLILIGSSNQPRTIKNPFTGAERSKMIGDACSEFSDNIRIKTINDYLYNENAWITEVQQKVFSLMEELGLPPTSRIAILGHDKDESSYYLKSFPWDTVDTGGCNTHNSRVIDATTIRKLMFERNIDYSKGVMPIEVYNYLLEFCRTSEFNELVKEYDHINEYKKQWAASPYPPQFMCSDAVVVQSGHVLLVKRGRAPGLGLWATPGGFVEGNLTCKDNAIKELIEETSIDLSKRTLYANISEEHMFDAPGRSLSGRTFTMAYLIELIGGKEGLPYVKGADDAAEAKWFPISEIDKMQDILFEDHYSILKHMIGKLT